jgi:hypothetical protein
LIRRWALDKIARLKVDASIVPYAGGCACAAVRYECLRLPYAIYACHCVQCQKRSGSLCAVTVQVATKALRVNGAVVQRTRLASSGNIVTLSFCPGCGSPLWSESSGKAGLCGITLGTLDNPHAFPISANIWTSAALPGAHLSPELENHPQQPERLPSCRP